MQNLASYLPQDRLEALEHGADLPDRVEGTVLFADISGFTPLTEALVRSLGPRRGAEELTIYLDGVYAALIGQVERYGGSVVGFAGDSITCWFDQPQSANRAVACAFEMQQNARSFAHVPLAGGDAVELQLKVALASGPVRRFVIGDPRIQRLDTLAGATLQRMAAGEHLAHTGEVLADEPTLSAAAGRVAVSAWRKVEDSQEIFGVLAGVLGEPQPGEGWTGEIQPGETEPDEGQVEPRTDEIPAETLRPWLLPAVYERERAGMGAFLTELRHVVALFMRFEGIDYDQDDQAGSKLDAFTCQVQAITERHGGTLLCLIIGDKGSYAYIAFGAPVAHEDDPRRAIDAALGLQSLPAGLPFLHSLQIGISRGTMRTGAYGGPTRRTYGVLGDEVNLAARLMQAAAAGQIVASGRVEYVASKHFVFEPIQPLKVKGKAEPVVAFLVKGPAQRNSFHLLDPVYTLPMVGRQAELEQIVQKMEQAAQGKGQIIAITAEAGMGKSRLVAEIIQRARGLGFNGYGGACQSDRVNTPYQVWRSIWQAFFNIDPEVSPRQQAQGLVAAVQKIAPHRLSAVPLLGGLLGIPVAENSFTRGLDPKSRKTALEATLVDCVKSAARQAEQSGAGLLFVLEDLHWMDAVSHDLLEEIGRAAAALPVLLVLAYRPAYQPQAAVQPAELGVESLPHFTKIELSELAPAEAEQALAAKLQQLFPHAQLGLAPSLTRQLVDRAQGNPFYLEELLNYLRDRGFDPLQAEGLAHIELPDSLHALVLSRIDQLGEYEKLTLKVASIIGRIFRARWLNGYYPELGDDQQVQRSLDQLHRLEITPLDSTPPDPAYLFKHMVTQEVTYESLPYGLRSQLHERLAAWLERTHSAPLPLDLLAYHYGRSANTAKQREYFHRAGAAAQAAYANAAALDYYARLLPLLDDPHAQIALHLNRSAVLQLLGEWTEAEAACRQALAISEQTGQTAALPQCYQMLGVLARLRGDYPAGLELLARACQGWEALVNPIGQAQALVETGIICTRKGEYAAAQGYFETGLTLARGQGEQKIAAQALHNLGNLAYKQGDFPAAQALYEESLALKRAVGDKPGMAASLGNLGNLANDLGDYPAARQLYGESLAIKREIGDKQGIASTLNNLATISDEAYDHAAIKALLEESLALSRELGDRQGVSIGLNNLGEMAVEAGDYAAARTLYEESLAIKREMGDPWGIAVTLCNLGEIAVRQGDLARAQQLTAESIGLFHTIGDRQGTLNCLLVLAFAATSQGDGKRAVLLLAVAETQRKALNLAWETTLLNLYQHTVTAAHTLLSVADFAAAWQAGETLTVEDVLNL